MSPSPKKSKKSSSSTARQTAPARAFRTLPAVDRDLENLAGIVVAINNAVTDLQSAFRAIEEHVQELDLKTIFIMNAVAITRVKHGGIVGLTGEPEKVTKKLMEWYREGGREQLLMKLQEAENAIKAAAQAGELGDEDETTEGQGAGAEGAPAKKDPGPTIN